MNRQVVAAYMNRRLVFRTLSLQYSLLGYMEVARTVYSYPESPSTKLLSLLFRLGMRPMFGTSLHC